MSFLASPGGTTAFDEFRRNSIAVLVAGVFYGIYTVLFAVGMYTTYTRLRTRRGGELQWRTPLILLVATITMFLLSTCHMVLIAVYQFNDGLTGASLVSLDQQLGYLFTANTAITSIIMIYRCYCIWGFVKRVIAGPILLLTAAIILGLVFPTSQTLAKTVVVLCDSTLVTCLTVGRIWYLARSLRASESKYGSVLGHQTMPGQHRVYSLVIVAVIESAAIYTTFLLFGVFSTCIPAIMVHRRLVSYTLMQITSIFPTLIIVLVALGRDMSVIVSSTAKSTTSVSTLIQAVDTNGDDYGSVEKGRGLSAV